MLSEMELLSRGEMRKLMGGSYPVSGVRYTNGQCYCDYTFIDTLADGSTMTWTLCDSPCSTSRCSGIM